VRNVQAVLWGLRGPVIWWLVINRLKIMSWLIVNVFNVLCEFYFDRPSYRYFIFLSCVVVLAVGERGMFIFALLPLLYSTSHKEATWNLSKTQCHTSFEVPN
jgi:hypothetical protein